LTKIGRVVEDSLDHSVQLHILQTAGGPEIGFSGRLIDAGSGVIVREDGVVATCAHNLRSGYPDIPVISRNLEVRLPLTNEWRPARVLVIDDEREMALLAIEKTEPGETFSAAQFGTPGAKLKTGTDVFAVGHPIPDNQLAVSPGRLHSIEILEDTVTTRKGALPGEDVTRPLIRFDANTAPGNSGGGLFAKKDGSLLGIVGKGDTRFGVGWAYPSSDIQNLLSRVAT
jgi:predicted outer membrane repeat protein